MTIERAHFGVLLRQIHEEEKDRDAQQEAICTLREVLLGPMETEWLVESMERREEPLPVRVGAVHLLGFHRPWRRLDLLHDDRVHDIPLRLAALAVAPEEERTLREAVISALGWQYLAEYNLWDTLLADPDAFLRRETLYELLDAPGREAVERVIAHLASETQLSVRSAISWGLRRHPRFYDTALPMLTRAGGEVYFEAVCQACETDPRASVRALLDADIKYFDVREALIQRLFQYLDPPRIGYLIDLMQEGRHPFAARVLREVGAEVVEEVIIQLNQVVQQRRDSDWTEEAAKLTLHYWDRFTPLREGIRDLLDDWRRHCPKVIHLAMGRNIYWRD